MIVDIALDHGVKTHF